MVATSNASSEKVAEAATVKVPELGPAPVGFVRTISAPNTLGPKLHYPAKEPLAVVAERQTAHAAPSIITQTVQLERSLERPLAREASTAAQCGTLQAVCEE
jgi:hypothetical protein